MLSVFALLAATNAPLTVPEPREGKGFICHLSSGGTLEFNVYLDAKVWQQRSFMPQRIYATTDHAVALTMKQSSPHDYLTLMLDRRTLVLTATGEGPGVKAFYKEWTCQMGEVIDFDPPNQF